jgi:hypothetical protein
MAIQAEAGYTIEAMIRPTADRAARQEGEEQQWAW